MNKKELEKLRKDFNSIGENAEVSDAFDFAYDKEKKSNRLVRQP